MDTKVVTPEDLSEAHYKIGEDNKIQFRFYNAGVAVSPMVTVDKKNRLVLRDTAAMGRLKRSFTPFKFEFVSNDTIKGQGLKFHYRVVDINPNPYIDGVKLIINGNNLVHDEFRDITVSVISTGESLDDSPYFSYFTSHSVLELTFSDWQWWSESYSSTGGINLNFWYGFGRNTTTRFTMTHAGNFVNGVKKGVAEGGWLTIKPIYRNRDYPPDGETDARVEADEFFLTRYGFNVAT